MKQRQYLKDYQPSVWQIPTLSLRFEILEARVLVHARYQMQGKAGASLRLDGRQMTLQSLRVDGSELSQQDYQLDDASLSLVGPADEFVLDICVELDPWSNTSLEGLYYAGNILCTQCESHGFSRIVYCLDRPDVMSIYDVQIEADPQRWPIMLANGDLTEQQELADGRRRVHWQDPHPKPCYLFALVAGDMASRHRQYTTSEGRDVAIGFYCDHGIEDKLEHAIDSLVRSMQWDEKIYGLACDLNTYNVVVAGAFNMGAMENKGLNIFNPKYVLADKDSATDHDFASVEAVIGHEYFHNWTGNRVTCRDWFQLSLKEGLTVFRDQQFSADCGAGPAQRIEQVKFLRARQFAEDAGPLAHPVRPQSYLEMNNFYTVTVYEKGAELVRLLHAREGAAGFRQGMDLYFQRHDGRAVTIEDFLAAHGDANKQDISKVLAWYGQAGTPLVRLRDEYADGRYRLHCTQLYPNHSEAAPVLIPIRLSLLSEQGDVLISNQVLELQETEQSFEITVEQRPIPVLFEGFSAPVNWDYAYTDAQLELIALHASDEFSRWEAVQRIYLKQLRELYAGNSAGLPDIFSQLLNSQSDAAVIAQLLQAPKADELLMQWPSVDPLRLAKATEQLELELAHQLKPSIESRLAELEKELQGPYNFEPAAAAARSLRARLLRLLSLADETKAIELAVRLYRDSDNLTDRLAALTAVNESADARCGELLHDFYRRNQADALVLDRWFSLQAMQRGRKGVERVAKLLEHPNFEKTNPNRARALLGVFGNNVSALYANGGMELLAKQVMEFDALNPQLASRLLTPFAAFTCVDDATKQRMKRLLENLQQHTSSPDVREQIERILGESS